MQTRDYASALYIPIAWELFHRDSRALAHRLMNKGPFHGIVAVTRGGLIPSSIIARELDLRVVESVGVASYDDRTQGEVRVIKAFNRDLVGDGSGWLVIDDLVDSGVTARAVRTLLPKAHMATVYAKPEGQAEVDTFVVGVRQDVWLLFPWDADLQPNEPLVRQQDALERNPFDQRLDR
ncbi:xanthine phosphoribosyltransferase [Pararhodospirillum oryzae]|uniref:Xanthine phosphoribosyltransferase n=1 Tax=Pararhodospirillum oryzae TaxID=478448 RepID=A0A512H5J6_9PROT|nr:xanthine phosphoribosyltransferase [Pararhodospirillum oryzae]GEO80742.1 xanthine phosphoribosyltransferase [Pararhodospirillum oryzae]